MKYLQDYMQEAQTKALEKAGAFFAFSNKQFDEQKKDRIKYSNCGMGMICPSENVKTLLDELDRAYKNGIEKDIAENGYTNIVKRELNNHEAYYTQDITDTCNALGDYPITKENIYKVFKNKEYIIL
ncbi:hypothetical protein M0R04_10135 [Candidatus Dojkabacteria bacterium]|jgi:hypothetical protein|nr:hypothetical protein [Candidatus Dojkabacteria bacterium]